MSPSYLKEAVGASGTGAVVVTFRSWRRRRGRGRPFIPGIRLFVRGHAVPTNAATRFVHSSRTVIRMPGPRANNSRGALAYATGR